MTEQRTTPQTLSEAAALPTLGELLARNAAADPQGPALVDEAGRETSWSQLQATTASLAAALADWGDTPPRYRLVALCLDSTPLWATAFLALRRRGWGCLSQGARLKAPELQSMLASFPIDLVLAEPQGAGSVAAVCGEAGIPWAVVSGLESDPGVRLDPGASSNGGTPRRRGRRAAAAQADRNAGATGTAATTAAAAPAPTASPAVLHLTSGSSGRRKGVVRGEANLVDEARGVAQALELRPTDRILCSTPVYHSFASGLLCAALWSLVADHRASIIAGVPYVFQFLSRTAGPVRRDIGALRLAVSGGAHMHRAWNDRFRQRFGLPVVQEYGLSEGGIATFNLDDPQGRPESVGRPIPGVRLSIVDPDDPHRALPPGETGEVVVHRRFCPTAYSGDPGESRRTFFAPDSVRTGDLGLLDDEGFLFLAGRSKLMINVAGTKVAPREVEAALLAHPAVTDAVVFDYPDDVLGETVRAVVVCRDGSAPTEPRLIAHCRRLLSAYKVPQAVYSLKSIPRTAAGKPDLQALKAGVRPPRAPTKEV